MPSPDPLLQRLLAASRDFGVPGPLASTVWDYSQTINNTDLAQAVIAGAADAPHDLRETWSKITEPEILQATYLTRADTPEQVVLDVLANDPEPTTARAIATSPHLTVRAAEAICRHVTDVEALTAVLYNDELAGQLADDAVTVALVRCLEGVAHTYRVRRCLAALSEHNPDALNAVLCDPTLSLGRRVWFLAFWTAPQDTGPDLAITTATIRVLADELVDHGDSDDKLTFLANLALRRFGDETAVAGADVLASLGSDAITAASRERIQRHRNDIGRILGTDERHNNAALAATELTDSGALGDLVHEQLRTGHGGNAITAAAARNPHCDIDTIYLLARIHPSELLETHTDIDKVWAVIRTNTHLVDSADLWARVSDPRELAVRLLYSHTTETINQTIAALNKHGLRDLLAAIITLSDLDKGDPHIAAEAAWMIVESVDSGIDLAAIGEALKHRDQPADVTVDDIRAISGLVGDL